MRFLIFSLIAFISSSVYSQSISIKRATGPITLDAEMNEPDWGFAEVANDFKQYFPMDTSRAIAQSEIRLTYDDNFIYVFARMERIKSNNYVTPTLRRDYRGEANDGITIVFDTFKDKTNGFLFGVNPFGVQREGLITNGGSGGGGRGGGGDLNLNWDNKWYSEAKIHEGYWTVEMAIPFKTIRFKDGLKSWLVNFYRIDSEFAERSTWNGLPRNFSLQTLAHNKELIWDSPLGKPGPNVSLIPYTAARTSRNFEEETPSESSVAFGGDAKIGLGPAMNLDLTVNPDFSQVEVDEQVTNLDRFEIFFPERRQFFLENADLFSDFGLDGIRPFFSRRIGVTRDTSTGQNVQNPIYFGARASGKINNNLRVGLLNMQAGEIESIGLPSTNYTVATFQQKVFSRSNIGMIFVNKQAFQDSIGGDFTMSPMQYSRTLGMDFNLQSADNKWNGKVFYHRSFDEEKSDSTFSTGARISYNTYAWDISATTTNTGSNFSPEVGFVRRRDLLRLAPTAFYSFYPKSKIIRSHGPGFDFDILGNETYGMLDYDINLMYRIRFLNTASFDMRLRQEYTYLFNDFDPTNTDGVELPADTDYANNVIIASFRSNSRNKLYFNISTRSGGYFNGTRINLDGEITYRMQPYALFTLNFTYNRIRLPQPYNSADLYLIGPRIDLTFTKNIFWTTFFQFNSQIQNLNINSRLQWRFKPVSDLFFVYTDNYFADAGSNGDVVTIGAPKARAFVLKLTYWLNL